MTTSKQINAVSGKVNKRSKRKLTLSLDETLIEFGKALAKKEGISLSKLVEDFLREQTSPLTEPLIIIEPDADILALMGKPALPTAPKTNREYYDEYYEAQRERYLENSEASVQ